MRLSRYTDYALRALMHVALKNGAPSSIPEISRAYAVSSDHLRKIVHDLGKAGFIATQRGRGGGLRLARPPSEINLGAVVRHTEDSFDLVPCPDCVIAPVCTLPRILDEAVSAFMAVLDRYTLADLLIRGDVLARMLEISSSGAVQQGLPALQRDDAAAEQSA